MSLRRLLSGLLLTGVLSAPALAADPAGTDDERETSAPKEVDKPVPVLSPAGEAAPAGTTVSPPPTAVGGVARPKVGDVAITGYFRGSFGASSQKGRMVCFMLTHPNGRLSKYRLGNECEVWGETHFTVVTYTGDNGSVATVHVMPTVFIPTTFIGYTPTGVINSPLAFSTSTGATLSFPNLYADIKGVPWLFGGTAWAGTRYYKRESVYISDFFYWNPSGVGAGIEDINLPLGLQLSYAAFAVDGRLEAGQAGAPELPNRTDFGVRNDVQLRGIKPWRSGEFQLGFQYIANYSSNPSTNGGWGVTARFVQQLLGGDMKLVFQYGQGAGTGFGTLARFYYPDFSLYNLPSEYRIRVVNVWTIQPIAAVGAQLAGVFQRDDLGSPGTRTDWYSAGGRVSVAFTEYFKLLGEVGYDRIQRNNGAPFQHLTKLTVAPTISAARGLLSRPELRLFYTWAIWNEPARVAGIDSARLYTDILMAPTYLAGSTFGVQAETWW